MAVASLRKVAVLGAGTMGAQIAAHLANSGASVLLLDRVLDQESAKGNDRNRLAKEALDLLTKRKPAALYDARLAESIRTGNFDDDMAAVKDCDWIVEAVAENPSIKKDLFRNVLSHCKPDAILSTNTSGLSVRAIAEEFPSEVRKRWLGVHFFNPPRYMRLVEINPLDETDSSVVQTITDFCSLRLGKTVVTAKDTPGFIANRIGLFNLWNAMRLTQQYGLSVEEVDELTGQVLGWPRSATFRLADIIGIDVLQHIAANFHEQTATCPDERQDVVMPPFVGEMVSRGLLGEKAGKGFYRKVISSSGPGSANLQAINWKTLEYRDRLQPSVNGSIKQLLSCKSLPERLRMIVDQGPNRTEPQMRFLWTLLSELWLYCAYRVPEISDSVADIDEAMKAGFNWELGPFEMWDAASVHETADKLRQASQVLPPSLTALLEQGAACAEIRWYRPAKPDTAEIASFDPVARLNRGVACHPRHIPLASATRVDGLLAKCAHASLLDLGDGIACIQFHSKMNAISEDILHFLIEALADDSPAIHRFDGFILASEGRAFSVGANLVDLLSHIDSQDWTWVENFIQTFQRATAAIRYCKAPVIAAPFGLCLGGGTEIALHAAGIQAQAELSMGLVETRVGLIPAGGGCKEMTLRAGGSISAPRASTWTFEANGVLQASFETLALAKTSASAYEAKAMGFLRPSDSWTMNPQFLVADAKDRALALARSGFAPVSHSPTFPAPGKSAFADMKMAAWMLREGGQISEYDQKILERLAYTLCGGEIATSTPISEEYLLGLERESFVSLCGEPKTQARIRHTLETGSALKN